MFSISGICTKMSFVPVLLTISTGFVMGLVPLELEGAQDDDPFMVALPSRDTLPPQGVFAGGSNSNVAEQQGAATYAFPIALPAGRNGIKPSLSFGYSSEGPLRGGLAVGWTFDVPSIERDPA